jgi:copper(I)-binding protein
MTSQITPSNIDGTFPVAGQDNSSQGFRDNFTNIKNNFTYAANEISELQSKGIFKTAIAGSTLNNDMQGAVLKNPSLQGTRESIYTTAAAAGDQTIDFNNGSYHVMTLAGSVVINFANFTSTSGSQVTIRVQVTVPNTTYTLSWPAAVSVNLNTIAGANGQVITFARPGTYIFELSTADGGATFSIADVTRNKTEIQGNLVLTTSYGNVTTTGITMTVSNNGATTVGNITADYFIGNIITIGPNSASFIGNVTAGNLIANSGIYGNIITAIQSNITLVGTLTTLSVSGNANVGNLTISGTTDFCGAITETGIQYITGFANAGSTQIYSNVSTVIVDHKSGTIGAYTLIMPATPANGQRLEIVFGNTITTLTHTAGSNILNGPLTTASNSGGGTWIYYNPTTTWYRI